MVVLELSLITSVRRPAPRIGGEMFRYRLHSPDGDDLVEATYAMSDQGGGGDPRQRW